ncbi:hypothetical protein D9757_011508 [Collybiopsis confluens]|uniref:Uncharacterized protein n=1 Tax=Collybiopsis confluens TaxID=2823264 RepID=A0A8H5H774_9AGAR|nr:hypothetical protein D9757_011508 [Collybiopsis confluens]
MLWRSGAKAGDDDNEYQLPPSTTASSLTSPRPFPLPKHPSTNPRKAERVEKLVPLRLNDLRRPVFFMDHSPHACLYISMEVIFRSRCVFISSTTYYPSIAETEGPVLFCLVSFPRPASPTPASIPPSRATGRFVRSYDLFMARAGSPAAPPAPP